MSETKTLHQNNIRTCTESVIWRWKQR